MGLIHAHLLQSLRRIRETSSFELAIYLFHKHVMAYPSEALCRPRRYEEAFIPSQAELKQRIGGGTALLDAMARVLNDALAHHAQDRRVIVLTDGWERSSRNTTAAQLRREIRKSREAVQVSVTGFVSRTSYPFLIAFAQNLGLPEDAYHFAQHDGDDSSVCDSITSMSAVMVDFATDLSHR